MTTISLDGPIARVGRSSGRSPRPHLTPILRLHHFVLLLLAAAGVVGAGRAGHTVDLSGSAAALVLSTGAVQVAIVVAAVLVDLALTAWLATRETRRMVAALERRVADAQAQAYRLQLQPHFVFNALQGAATLVHQDAVKADLMLVALCDFLRLTMQTAESHEIPLVTELALLDRYVEVMRYRFGEQLRITVNADPETLDARVPQLLLQPLVENAIRHGVRDGACRIHVRVLRDGDTLRCLVRDEGPGLLPGARPAGIGVRSTRGRLEALYGLRGRLALATDAGGGVSATVTLPFHATGDERAA